MILNHVVSRHHPSFDVANSRLGTGRDGNVYLVNAAPGNGQALRVSIDGANRVAGPVGYSSLTITANSAGVVATTEINKPAQVALWDNELAPIGQVTGFVHGTVGGTYVGLGAPSDVHAGASGDFYAIDQYAARVLRIGPDGVRRRIYPLDGIPEPVPLGSTVGLRVSESQQRLYTAWPSGRLWVSGFDGTPLWSVGVDVAVGDVCGVFDVAADGRLYALATDPTTHVKMVDVYDPGQTLHASFPLAGGPSVLPPAGMRVLGDTLIVKRPDPTVLFEVYDLAGKFVRAVAADVAQFTVQSPSEIWTAGEPVPLTMSPADPALRVWLRPLGVPEFTELPRTDGQVAPPADARGLYELRVSPDVAGRVSDYTVNGVVELRAPDAEGTVSILTHSENDSDDPTKARDRQQHNRFYYGKGEPIWVKVIVRVPAGLPVPASVPVRLMHAGQELARIEVAVSDGRGKGGFDATVTGALDEGRYVLDADLPGLTVAPQFLEIGPGLAERPRFHLTQHGDYVEGMPLSDIRNPNVATPILFADVPDTTADFLARARKLGINLFLDRLADRWPYRFSPMPADIATINRLKADDAGVAEEKAVFESPASRAIGGYGAYGIEEQPILLYRDTPLPLADPAAVVTQLRETTTDLLPYPAFRGWSWAASWWQAIGADAANPDEKAAYAAAVDAAHATSAWPEVLDTVSNRVFALKVDTERQFREALESVTTGKISAMTGPYPGPETAPPVTFQNADEVDLHYQAEQLPPPQVSAHHVDFYKRPGKPAWGHLELSNDDGTGGMYLPSLFQMAMRGVNGVGAVGDAGAAHGGSHQPRYPDPRSGGVGSRPGDARSGGAGKTSILRAAYDVFRAYGEAAADGDNVDYVAIVVSTRMLRIEIADGQIRSTYFDALFEAYNACLYAHSTARFVFTEDLGDIEDAEDPLADVDAVLVVGQKVAFEPEWAAALAKTDKPVYYDRNCRDDLVGDFTPLPLGFDQVANHPAAMNDESAYPRYRQYFIEHAAALRTEWGTAVGRVAECDNPEVLLSERKIGVTTYIWAVNNTMLDWDPGLIWRVSLAVTQRVPVLADLKLDVPFGHRVVDVLASANAPVRDGVVTADLRSVPVRLFAIEPPGPPITAPALQDKFGPHARDIALSGDGNTALVTCFNWDHNLYGVDLATGDTAWRRKVGHFFAFDPAVSASGFTVQGFDVSTAEGYHLYQLDGAGAAQRRFALFGLPKRATDYAFGEWQYDLGINNFAVAPDDSWVATCGDLGLVVWDSAGGQRWANEWWPTRRTPQRLVALDNETLIAFAGRSISGLAAADGRELWSLTVAPYGNLLGGTVSADRRTAVFWSDTDSGRVYVVRDGAVVNTIATAVEELAVSADGTMIAVTTGRQLRVFDAGGGLLWAYTGDDLLRRPRISADGGKLAVGSELGTLVVLDRSGAVLLADDLGALPVPTWLPDGDLFVATWMGRVMRLGADLSPKWEQLLHPTEENARAGLRAPDPTPTVRKTGWGNASAQPRPLTPNLLTDCTIDISAEDARHALVYADLLNLNPPRLTWQNPVDTLIDGNPAAPPVPWLPWWSVCRVDSDWVGTLTITIDTLRTQLSVEAITFVEDPDYPESWLRDVLLQWWDTATDTWRDGPYLLSDSAVHTHELTPAINAARFRLATTGGGSWPSGNIRLSELVFHGTKVGCSHPDVVAGNGRAVLFDERESDIGTFFVDVKHNCVLNYTDSFSGEGKCLELTNAGQAEPVYVLTQGTTTAFGTAIPNWDFQIVEQPQSGAEYRYLQFAWRAVSTTTTGISLLIGLEWPGRNAAIAVSTGDASFESYLKLGECIVAGGPSTTWSTVTVDLWDLGKGQLGPIRCLSLLATGGGARFDQLVLGRTRADLPIPEDPVRS